MNKEQVERKEVLVSRKWFEDLLWYSQQSKRLLEGKEKIKNKYQLAILFGYISSAEFIIKNERK